MIFLDRSNFQATPPPILIDNGIAVLENEVIERHIMKNIPGGHNLFVQDQGVSKLIENVYSKVRTLTKSLRNFFTFSDVCFIKTFFLFQFKIMLLKKDEHSKASLLANLKKINTHLVRIQLKCTS